MRARIIHEERRSLLGRLRHVDVCVRAEFTDRERAIIRDRQLQDVIVLERFADRKTVRGLDPGEGERWDGSFHLRIRHLLRPRGDQFALDNPSDAKAYEVRLIEALGALQQFIKDNAEIGTPTRWTFR